MTFYRTWKYPVTHLAADDYQRTLCGVEIVHGYWESGFNQVDEDEIADGLGSTCRRCQSIAEHQLSSTENNQ